MSFFEDKPTTSAAITERGGVFYLVVNDKGADMPEKGPYRSREEAIKEGNRILAELTKASF